MCVCVCVCVLDVGHGNLVDLGRVSDLVWFLCGSLHLCLNQPSATLAAGICRGSARDVTAFCVYVST